MRDLVRAATPALLLGGAAGLVLLAVLVSTGLSDPVDGTLIDVVRSAALANLLSPLRWITELGSTWAVAAVAVCALVLGLLIGPRRLGMLAAITILLASIGNSLLKITVARQRPDMLEPLIEERGFSFPSGHAALGMVAWGILAVLISRSRLPLPAQHWVTAIIGLVVFLIGASRVWLGVHFPTDVLAGWIAGGMVVLAFAALTRSVRMAPDEVVAAEDQAAPRSGRPAPG
ncbi:MAG: phosphatase PAP2 family protein [Candidatus Limnocylindria bacterium]